MAIIPEAGNGAREGLVWEGVNQISLTLQAARKWINTLESVSSRI